MNKILWGVCGIGLGHARRSKLIAENVKANIKFVSYERGYEYLGGVRMEGYNYRGKEAWSFLLNLFGVIKDFNKIRKSYETLRRYASRFKPDLIVADTEPITIHYARMNGKKHLTISNLPLVLDYFDELPVESASLKIQHKLVEKIEAYMEEEAALVIVPSFKRRKKGKRVYVGPVARCEKDGNDFIYVNVGGHEMERRIMKKVIRKLKRIDEKFVVASNFMYREYKRVKNIEIYPFVESPEKFISRSKGVITTAGLTIIHEAMTAGKPILAIPIPNHIEQITNAYLVEKNRLGEAIIMQKLDEKTLSRAIEFFVENVEEYKIRRRESGLSLAASLISKQLRNP